MGATEKLRVFLVELSICKKNAEANILAVSNAGGNALPRWKRNTKILFPSNGKICQHLEILQNSFKIYFYLDGIEVELNILNPFLSEEAKHKNASNMLV
jgi:hypothetical protein